MPPISFDHRTPSSSSNSAQTNNYTDAHQQTAATPQTSQTTNPSTTQSLAFSVPEPTASSTQALTPSSFDYGLNTAGTQNYANDQNFHDFVHGQFGSHMRARKSNGQGTASQSSTGSDPSTAAASTTYSSPSGTWPSSSDSGPSVVTPTVTDSSWSTYSTASTDSSSDTDVTASTDSSVDTDTTASTDSSSDTDATASTASTQSVSTDSTSAQITQMLADLNASRASEGKAPLTLDPTLSALAQSHSDDMEAQDSTFHNSLADILATGATGAAQNITGPGYSADAANAAFYDEKNDPTGNQGHYDNMMGDYTKVGIGVSADGRWTIDFSND